MVPGFVFFHLLCTGVCQNDISTMMRKWSLFWIGFDTFGRKATRVMLFAWFLCLSPASFHVVVRAGALVSASPRTHFGKRKKKPPRQLLKWRMTLKLMWQGSCGVGIANRGLAHACAQKLKNKWFEESFVIQFCCTGMNGKTTRGHSAMILRPWAPFGMPGLARGVPGCHGVAICDPPGGARKPLPRTGR